MRAVSRAEQDVLARLAARYSDLAELEQELGELAGLRLERRRREYAEREGAAPTPADPAPQVSADPFPNDALPPRPARIWPAVLLMGAVLAVLAAAAVLPIPYRSVAATTATAVATAKPTVKPATAPTARASMPVRPTPALAPLIAAAVNPWTPAVCDWAIANLETDARLDRAAAASGRSPDYYREAAAHWDGIGQLVAIDCGRRGGEPGEAGVPTCSTAMAWLSSGAASHELDPDPAHRGWNAAWSAFYRSLEAIFAPGCGVDSVG